ncbi:MAG TPA: tetratricopeptide repeat protein [Thermoanaerobaculia bacterium]|nr:tetratricopeptide repeat protein [Thermoanaerobaculia bacterium]
MKIKQLLAVFLAVLLLHGSAATLFAYAETEPDPDTSSSKKGRESELYEDGTDAINDEDWDEAIDKFSAVVEMKGSRADGALYWTAYALAKLGRRSEALQTVSALKKSYPKSRWLNDANALDLEVRQSRGEHIAPEHVDDDELKVMAIRSLMNSDPERAYPLLEKILNSSKASRKMKEQALFILSQSDSGRGQQLIASIARGTANPSLQKEAVRYLGVAGGERNSQLLSELYSSAASDEVKKEVLRAFMISGDRARVVAAAKTEKDPEIRKEAIHLLGVMGARQELYAMYSGESSRDVRKTALEALFIAGDMVKIGELARNEKDPELRAEAIRRLGLMGGATAKTLLSLYASESNAEVKNAVIEALFLQNNSRALIDLSKKETNHQLKREIIQKLSIMGDQDAVDYMLQILNED